MSLHALTRVRYLGSFLPHSAAVNPNSGLTMDFQILLFVTTTGLLLLTGKYASFNSTNLKGAFLSISPCP
jgi:hypothetical protein